MVKILCGSVADLIDCGTFYSHHLWSVTSTWNGVGYSDNNSGWGYFITNAKCTQGLTIERGMIMKFIKQEMFKFVKVFLVMLLLMESLWMGAWFMLWSISKGPPFIQSLLVIAVISLSMSVFVYVYCWAEKLYVRHDDE